MNIVYDISVLGVGYSDNKGRTGIFRVVENLAYGLTDSPECIVNFCSDLSLASESIDYLKENSKLIHVPFLNAKNADLKIYNHCKQTIASINQKSIVTIPGKVVRKTLWHTLNFLAKNTKIITSNDLMQVDIFHSPFYALPKVIKESKNVKPFLTIYDLIPALYPHFFDNDIKDSFQNIIDSITQDCFITCISHSTKNDLCNYLKDLDPSRVFVTHLAASELFYQCDDSQKIDLVKEKYSIPRESSYILSVNTLEPRKNIEFTIQCFADLIKQENIRDLYLVLVGTKGWKYDKIFDKINDFAEIKNKIIFTGYVADEDLAALYSGATTFVYPSFYEGFGLPPLEAMQCGVPVITSNTSSLPEVVGGAGIMIYPTDSDALCQGMYKLYTQSSLRESMTLRSIEQAKKFSWQKCTQQTIDAYKLALDN